MTVPSGKEGTDDDGSGPERPRDGPVVQRRTETDKFMVYVARSFVQSNTHADPVLPWLAVRLSAPEYDVGTQFKSTRPLSEVIAPIAGFESALTLLHTPGRCRELRFVTLRGSSWVWSKVASVAEQHTHLRMAPPSHGQASRDVVTDEWKARHGTKVPVVNALRSGRLSADYANSVSAVALEDVYVDPTRYKTNASTILIWGLYRDPIRRMSIVSMCQSNTRDANHAAEYKRMIQGFELMMSYSPDTNLDARLGGAPPGMLYTDYTPSRHAFSVMMHSVPVWGPELADRLKVAFFDLLEADRRMKMPLRYIKEHYLPCQKETRCDPADRWSIAKSRPREVAVWPQVGTCNHIRFTGDTTMRDPSSVWTRPHTHRLEADGT